MISATLTKIIILLLKLKIHLKKGKSISSKSRALIIGMIVRDLRKFRKFKKRMMILRKFTLIIS
jgi:hypothetical protein